MLPMNPLNYQMVFDASANGYDAWYFPAIGLLLTLIGAILLRYADALPFTGPASVSTKAFRWFFFTVSVVFTLGSITTYTDYLSAKNAIAENRAKVVEGVVTEFSPMPASGHGSEHFCVRDVCFSFSDNTVNAGFNRTSAHGGPIWQGKIVRVHYVGNIIVKLEIVR
ncbi:hypothetical protein [Undibacterium sp. TJN19]|uniref:hypothetical protein n=1 Tax=Undibacterium sp. TJN19 TaxID=3413055 RepID=UPI003BF3A189